MLYSFQGGSSDGFWPAGGVVFDKTGNLYGATTGAGTASCAPDANLCGLVYQLSPPAKKGDPWAESIIIQFKGKESDDASLPSGGLIIDSSGNLYGVTAYGGTGDCVLLGTKAGCGTVYELSPPKQKGGQWTETILYSFKSGHDGYYPWGNLTFDKAGNLYGATQFGGGKGNTCNAYYGGNCGTVFELSLPKKNGGQWTEQVLHSFGGGTDGAMPNGGLVLGARDAIYGTTSIGGNQQCNFGNGNLGCGIVFELAPPKKEGGAWIETILDRFKYPGNDGAGPRGNLIFDAKGQLYGTAGGGSWQSGVVFRLANVGHGRWRETVLYSFTGRGDGLDPGNGLVFDASGYLYGTALGGQTNKGLVFRLKPPKQGNSWSFSALYNFTGAPDGNNPTGDLVFHETGHLYGTTEWGGDGQFCQGGCGSVFEVSPP